MTQRAWSVVALVSVIALAACAGDDGQNGTANADATSAGTAGADTIDIGTAAPPDSTVAVTNPPETSAAVATTLAPETAGSPPASPNSPDLGVRACPLLSTEELAQLAHPPVDLIPFAVFLPGDRLADDGVDGGEALLAMPPGSLHCSWADDPGSAGESEWNVVIGVVTGEQALRDLGFDAAAPFEEFGEMDQYAVELPGTDADAFWTELGLIRSGAAFVGDRVVFIQVLAPEGNAFDGPAALAAALARS